MRMPNSKTCICMKESIRQFTRFAIVGAVCTGIDAALFYFFRTLTSYQVSLVCSYILSLTVNYFLTVYWTFGTSSSIRNLIGIVSAHLFNLFVVRMGLMYLFADILSIDDRIAYIPTLAISVVTNFLIIKIIINRLR